MINTTKIRKRSLQKDRQETIKHIDTQIEFLWERIAQSKTDAIKSAWTVAILELMEIKKYLVTKEIK